MGRVGGTQKFCWLGIFYQAGGIWGRVILMIRAFFKAKNSFLRILNINKIKFSMTCLSKEYEIKTKLEQEQWLQLKLTFLLVYNLKIVIQWGELTFGGGEVYWGERRQSFSRWGGNEQIFSWWLGLPSFPLSRKTLYAATPNRMIYLLFHDHKPLIMYQSNWHQILSIIIN